MSKIAAKIPKKDLESFSINHRPEPWRLESRHSGELMRLHKRINAMSGFRLIFLDFNNPIYRDSLIQNINNATPKKMAVLPLENTLSDFVKIETRLFDLANRYDAIHITHIENWLTENKSAIDLFQGFNYHRETIAEKCPVTLLFWMIARDIKDFALTAQDMWNWRTDVFNFTIESQTRTIKANETFDSTNVSKADRLTRIEEIKQYLHNTNQTGSAKANLFAELGGVYRSMGQWSEANDNFDKAKALYLELDDRRNEAIILGEQAEILKYKGEIDEALNLHQKRLKVFEVLGDVREKALTLGRIADILQTRGQLDEALKIREHEQLPVYEQLGDVHSKALTLGKIADILQARGQLDEALKIREHDELPVFEQLGDVREKAVTRGKIADILQARGQLDEALKIREHEQLPVYEQLGDVHSKAVTLGQIADILQARGQLDEALKIREHEQLPVFELLGDVRSLLVGRAKVAMLLWQIDAQNNVAKVQELLCLALKDARRLQIPEASQIEELLQQMNLTCAE